MGLRLMWALLTHLARRLWGAVSRLAGPLPGTVWRRVTAGVAAFAAALTGLLAARRHLIGRGRDQARAEIERQQQERKDAAEARMSQARSAAPRTRAGLVERLRRGRF